MIAICKRCMMASHFRYGPSRVKGINSPEGFPSRTRGDATLKLYRRLVFDPPLQFRTARRATATKAALVPHDGHAAVAAECKAAAQCSTECCEPQETTCSCSATRLSRGARLRSVVALYDGLARAARHADRQRHLAGLAGQAPPLSSPRWRSSA